MQALCDSECPIKKTSAILEGKWTNLIVRELLSGKKRYHEFQRALPDISPKMLAVRLKHLEKNLIITRTVFPTIPPSTEYEFTPLGQQLHQVMQAMADFGEKLD